MSDIYIQNTHRYVLFIIESITEYICMDVLNEQFLVTKKNELKMNQYKMKRNETNTKEQQTK